MCTDGVYGLFGNGLFDPYSQGRFWGNGYTNPFIRMAGALTSSLGYCPSNVWAARNWTQAANSWTYQAAYPYGFHFNFSGTPRYVVADSSQMSYNTALGLQTGGIYGVPTFEQLQLGMQNRTGLFVTEMKSTLVCDNLQKAKSIGACKDQEFMKADENKELRDEVIAIEKKAEELLKQLEKVMKNEDNSLPEVVDTKINVLLEKAKELVGESDALYKRIEEASETYKEDAKAKAEAEEAEEDGNTDGTSTVTTVEGDKKLEGNDKLGAEYGVKAPVVVEDEVKLSSVVRDVKDHTSNENDSNDYNKMFAMFTEGVLSKANIVEVMDDLLNSKNHDLYDGIYEMDKSKEIMDKFIDALKNRITDLKANEYLTPEEKSEVMKMISAFESALGSGDKDIKSSISVEIGGKKMSGNDALKAIVAKLKGKGTQADFDAKVTAKKTERENKAKKDFYTAHAKTKTGKSVKDENAALPDGVTYLPNSKQFQWKFGDKVFKGESYTKLNDAVLNSKKADIIAAWNDVLKKLDENLK